MDKLNFLNDLAKKICDALPLSVHAVKKDVEKNLHATLQNAFHKLDLVTREEFDVQKKVLERSRQKITALEKRINELEEK